MGKAFMELETKAASRSDESISKMKSTWESIWEKCSMVWGYWVSVSPLWDREHYPVNTNPDLMALKLKNKQIK